MVTDLGTEFGVEVERETGRTISHVFRGSVRVQPISTSNSTTAARTLRADETVCVEKKGEAPSLAAAPSGQVPTFVRKIPKPAIKRLDLVDVVAGGDGFSGHIDRGIDPRTGTCHDQLPKPVLKIEDYAKGDRKYHRVTDRPGVDGVFVPDGSRGPFVVSSAGHQFDDFPATSGDTSGDIWAGGVFHLDPPFKPIRTVLNGVDYATSGHRILYVAANQGITFDLDALRRANPGSVITRFCAVAGNVEAASEKDEAVYADIWVLVDGAVRFRRREINSLNGAFTIAVPLTNADRFLTLATTDGGNGISWDQIIYGDPRLELTTTEPADGGSLAPTNSSERR